MNYAALVPGKVIDFDISRGNSYADETIKYFKDEDEAMMYAIKNPLHTIIRYEEVALGFMITE
jgi:hypothetical protein